MSSSPARCSVRWPPGRMASTRSGWVWDWGWPSGSARPSARWSAGGTARPAWSRASGAVPASARAPTSAEVPGAARVPGSSRVRESAEPPGSPEARRSPEQKASAAVPSSASRWAVPTWATGPAARASRTARVPASAATDRPTPKARGERSPPPGPPVPRSRSRPGPARPRPPRSTEPVGVGVGDGSHRQLSSRPPVISTAGRPVKPQIRAARVRPSRRVLQAVTPCRRTAGKLGCGAVSPPLGCRNDM